MSLLVVLNDRRAQYRAAVFALQGLFDGRVGVFLQINEPHGHTVRAALDDAPNVIEVQAVRLVMFQFLLQGHFCILEKHGGAD